ncbi:hypothetical protein KFZ70_16445 [Tamlana fucoidanivorans]|uniref:Uncharacterized protein n=1 Tax=Allotamlana fucoidanivorans TaxID=2583814 RepID=A0A5C4SHE4_9FLAO|nr:hypothetical protein [Tamlana fucoidanivorans]TNJ42870.1 hypothetical protein FGF67_12845 [Tamlana fucoidanivorans]
MINQDLLITFIAILAGLGLTDLIHSFHRLLRKRHTISWHWLPLAHTFMSFQAMIIIWYNIQAELNSPLIATSLGFFIWLVPIILILLVMLTVLPDREPDDGFNLLEWYFGQRKYYFTLLTLFVFSYTLNRFIMYEHKYAWMLPLILSVFYIILIFTKKYWVHVVFTIFLLAFFVLNYFLQGIGYV